LDPPSCFAFASPIIDPKRLRIEPLADTRILLVVPIHESTPARLRVEEMPEVYSRLAPLYKIWQKLVHGRSLHAALEMAALCNRERVLEIAVGPGTVFESLGRANPDGLTIGIDLTPGMLDRTRRLLRRASLTKPALCRSDALRLPFANGSFDLVFSSYFLDLLSADDIEIAIDEMRRVLRPSGRLVVTYLLRGAGRENGRSHGRGNSWFDHLWNALYFLAPVLLGGSRPISLIDYLPSAGFSITERRCITERGIPAEVILARTQTGAKSELDPRQQ